MPCRGEIRCKPPSTKKEERWRRRKVGKKSRGVEGVRRGEDNREIGRHGDRETG